MRGGVFILSLGLIFCGMIACTPADDPAPTFKYVIRENLRTLDPVLASDIYSQIVISQVYETLYHFHYLKRPLQIEPLLADGLPEISPDGRTYTIRLKKNVAFHPHSSFQGPRWLTAQDVIYSWKRVADPANRSESFWIFQNRIQGLDEWRTLKQQGRATYDTPVEGLSVSDTHTLIVKLKAPFYQWTSLLTMAPTSVVAREVVEATGSHFGAQATGTGPFRWRRWLRGSQLLFERFPEYRNAFYPTEGEPGDQEKGLLQDSGKKIPFVDRIEIAEITESQPQWLLFLKGQLDVLLMTKDFQHALLRGKVLREPFLSRGVQMEFPSSTDLVYIGFNTENPFLKNKKLRQAMSLAFDRAIFSEKFFNNHAVLAHGPIPPQLEGYRTAPPKNYSKLDLPRARQLMIEAGFPEGRGLPEFDYEMASNHTMARQTAEYFQQQMSQIGVRLRITPNTWPQFSEKVKSKKADLFDLAWNADYPDAENFLQMFYGKNISPGPNASNFSSPLFDRWFEEARALPPGPARTSLYEKMEDFIIEEAPILFELHRVRVVAKQPWLKNYKHEFMILDTMKYYRVDQAQKSQLRERF